MASTKTLQDDVPKSFGHYKVDAWLSTATEPAKLSGSVVKPAPSHKRKRPNSDHIQAADHCRKPLGEAMMNPPAAKHIESDPPKKIRKAPKILAHEQGPRRISPRKNMPTSSQQDGDRASTGYSRALQHEDIPLLPRRNTKSNSSTQSRSSSPVKTIHDLIMADPPITFSEANSKTIQPPATVSQLYKKVLDVSDGFNILPESLKDGIITYCEEFETKTPRNEYFKKSSNSLQRPTQEELCTWEAVKRIRKNATRCSEDGDCEAGWGEMVYSQILDVALRHSPYKHGVGWKNITTARIEPKSLGPRHLSGKLFGSKMVDYSMILLPDDRMHQAILQVLRDLPEEDQNVNQTRSAPIKYRPITVNIEVKLPGQGKDQTMVQLAVWAAAQLEKLNALSGTPAPIGLPLVSVEGHDWRLYNIYQKEDREVVRQTVWGNDVFGDSSSILGIYKIIAAVQILAEWSHTDYRSWFEKDVLKLLPEI